MPAELFGFGIFLFVRGLAGGVVFQGFLREDFRLQVTATEPGGSDKLATDFDLVTGHSHPRAIALEFDDVTDNELCCHVASFESCRSYV